MPTVRKQKLEYKLLGMDTPQFAILKDEVLDHPLQIENTIQFSTSNPLKTIKCAFQATYKDGGEAVMKMVMELVFELSGESWAGLKADDGNTVIPKDFLWHLGTLAIGAARGALFAYTRNTNLNSLTLPLFDLTGIITNDMVIKGTAE